MKLVLVWIFLFVCSNSFADESLIFISKTEPIAVKYADSGEFLFCKSLSNSLCDYVESKKVWQYLSQSQILNSLNSDEKKSLVRKVTYFKVKEELNKDVENKFEFDKETGIIKFTPAYQKRIDHVLYSFSIGNDNNLLKDFIGSDRGNDRGRTVDFIIKSIVYLSSAELEVKLESILFSERMKDEDGKVIRTPDGKQKQKVYEKNTIEFSYIQMLEYFDTVIRLGFEHNRGSKLLSGELQRWFHDVYQSVQENVIQYENVTLFRNNNRAYIQFGLRKNFALDLGYNKQAYAQFIGELGLNTSGDSYAKTSIEAGFQSSDRIINRIPEWQVGALYQQTTGRDYGNGYQKGFRLHNTVETKSAYIIPELRVSKKYFDEDMDIGVNENELIEKYFEFELKVIFK